MPGDPCGIPGTDRPKALAGFQLEIEYIFTWYMTFKIYPSDDTAV